MSGDRGKRTLKEIEGFELGSLLEGKRRGRVRPSAGQLRHRRLIAALNRKTDILTTTSAKSFQSSNLACRRGSSKVSRFKVSRFRRSGCTVAIETERGIDSLAPAI